MGHAACIFFIGRLITRIDWICFSIARATIFRVGSKYVSSTHHFYTHHMAHLASSRWVVYFKSCVVQHLELYAKLSGVYLDFEDLRIPMFYVLEGIQSYRSMSKILLYWFQLFHYSVGLCWLIHNSDHPNFWAFISLLWNIWVIIHISGLSTDNGVSRSCPFPGFSSFQRISFAAEFFPLLLKRKRDHDRGNLTVYC